jgi:hypothetical protein
MTMEKLKNFINESKTFCAFSFHGRYDMDRNVFLRLYEHYQKTGENYLDVYSELTWLNFDENKSIRSSNSFPMEIHDPDECNKLEKYVSIAKQLELFDPDDYNILLKIISRYRAEYTEYIQTHPKYKKYKEAKLGTPAEKAGPE